MDKLCLTTLAIGNNPVLNVSLPIFGRLCERWGCSLRLMDEYKYGIKDFDRDKWSIVVERFQMGDLFEDFDRVLYLDGDVVVSPECPNLFEMVPATHVGVVFEDAGSRRGPRRRFIKQIQSKANDSSVSDWTEGFFNVGVTLFSRAHREMFRDFPKHMIRAWGPDQATLNYLVRKHGYPVKNLGYKFNHMSMFSEPWNGADRRDSYIIHYAGGGFPGGKRVEQMREDARYFWG